MGCSDFSCAVLPLGQQASLRNFLSFFPSISLSLGCHGEPRMNSSSLPCDLSSMFPSVFAIMCCTFFPFSFVTFNHPLTSWLRPAHVSVCQCVCVCGHVPCLKLVLVGSIRCFSDAAQWQAGLIYESFLTHSVLWFYVSTLSVTTCLILPEAFVAPPVSPLPGLPSLYSHSRHFPPPRVPISQFSSSTCNYIGIPCPVKLSYY